MVRNVQGSEQMFMAVILLGFRDSSLEHLIWQFAHLISSSASRSYEAREVSRCSLATVHATLIYALLDYSCGRRRQTVANVETVETIADCGGLQLFWLDAMSS